MMLGVPTVIGNGLQYSKDGMQIGCSHLQSSITTGSNPTRGINASKPVPVAHSENMHEDLTGYLLRAII